jgi:iron complex transport system ATP-binding protein
MIALNHLSYTKHGKRMIHEVNATFNVGLIHAIIGPNGAGKSTLLNCIGGLISDYSGEIRWKNNNITNFSPLEFAQQRAYLTQQQTLAFPLTVKEVIEAGRFPFYSSVSSIRDKEIIEEMIALFDLESFLSRTYNTLSGGEKQRVQFARVFAQAYNTTNEEEKILLLDEPLSHLDISHQFEFLEITRAFTTKHNLITILVLHDLALALIIPINACF